ncbi:unnamed protein product [Colias eurytheme]|nr:unnamed protein product [Colias eurytheme]
MQLEKFDGTNFKQWKFQIKCALRAKGLDINIPKPTTNATQWNKDDGMAMYIITSAMDSMDFKQVALIENCESLEVLTKLESIYEQKSEMALTQALQLRSWVKGDAGLTKLLDTIITYFTDVKVCGATPTLMNDLMKVTARPENEDAFKYGLSTLHAWIRCMEMILHISYNISFEKCSATTPEHKKLKEEKKKYVRTRFRELLGLHIDKPRQDSGNSNDGNTARRFFQNYQCSSEITGVDEELIKRFEMNPSNNRDVPRGRGHSGGNRRAARDARRGYEHYSERQQLENWAYEPQAYDPSRETNRKPTNKTTELRRLVSKSAKTLQQQISGYISK